MEDKPKIYIEASVVSYLVARPSKDPMTSFRQVITEDWWYEELPKLDGQISRYVIEEATRGDAKLAQKRLAFLDEFNCLNYIPQIDQLANLYLKETGLPEKCRLDCQHMATASIYGIKYFASWNCKHIVNGVIIDKIQIVNDALGISTPNIRTPEELYGVDHA